MYEFKFLIIKNTFISEQLIQTSSANLGDLTLTLSPTDSDSEDAKNSFNKMVNILLSIYFVV